MAKNNQKIDLQNLHELNFVFKICIAAALVAVILVIGYFVVFQDQLAELDSAKAKEEELKQSYQEKSIKAANLENLKLELAALHTSFNQLFCFFFLTLHHSILSLKAKATAEARRVGRHIWESVY